MIFGMSHTDFLTFVAILIGPLIAIQLTRYLDEKKESKERKLSVFKTLMSTRSYNVSWDHDYALNRIDLEFDNKNKNEKKVIDAWKAYLDLLNTKDMELPHWNNRRIDLLVDMLYEMAVVLNYEFDKTHIKNASYSPVAHGDLEEQQRKIRLGVIDLLEGNKDLPMRITKFPTNNGQQD